MSKGWMLDRYRHIVASYGAGTRNSMTPIVFNRLSFGACGSMPYNRQGIDEFEKEYGVKPLNITDKKVKREIFSKLQNDDRFRRVHAKFNTVLFNFKIKDGKKEKWKGGSYTINKDGRVSYSIYVSPKRGKVRYSLRNRPIFKIMYKDVDEFVDALYDEMIRMYKKAEEQGFQMKGGDENE